MAVPALAADVTMLRLAIASAKPPYTALLRISYVLASRGSDIIGGPSDLIMTVVLSRGFVSAGPTQYQERNQNVNKHNIHKSKGMDRLTIWKG